MSLLSSLPIGTLVIVVSGEHEGKTGQIVGATLVRGYYGSVFDSEPRPGATRSPDWISCEVELDGHGAGTVRIPERWLHALTGADM